MRKKLLKFTAIAVMFVFVACSNEDKVPELEKRTLTFTVNMPDDNPATRVDLDQNGKTVELTWTQSDNFPIVFVQGTFKETTTSTVKQGSISNNGKTAEFNFPVPAGLDLEQPFDVYGVYGGGGTIDLTGTNPRAILPSNAGSAGSLEVVQNRGYVMLKFELKNVDGNNPPTSLTFEHLGSLFSINFNNLNATIAPLLSAVTEVRLVGVTGPENDEEWAFNALAGGQFYDLVTGTFEDLNTAGNYITFNPANINVVLGTLTLWGWYPTTGEEWPELEMQMTIADGTVAFSSNNTRPVKTPFVGRAYHTYITNDGVLPLTFSFANDQFVAYPSN